MEQKLSSSHRRGDLSASDSDSNPETEFSGDDDRNHKHRRREIRPQSSEFDASQSVSSRPFNKNNKSFQNGNFNRGHGPRANGGWRNSGNELFKTDRRHFDTPMFSIPQMDVNQRVGIGKMQTHFGGSGFARGRGKESWDPHAPRFGSMDFFQASNHGSVSSNIFAGRGLSSVHIAPWNPYGLLPGIPGGGLDAMHSIGVNITPRPPMNPPGTGIIRQKCSDFEERGFCLRGDICPMEHGVNRIVVDDVQSLSKFNLPVSIPGGNVVGVGGGSGPLTAGTATTSFSVNSTEIHRKMGKSKSARKGTNSHAVENIPDAAAVGNDFYDPDQPLLNKTVPESSTALSLPCSPDIQEEPILGVDRSVTNPDEVHNSSGIYQLYGGAGNGSNKPSLTLPSLGSLSGGGSRPDQKGIKAYSRNCQNPQKAMRTVFVNGIPQKDNNIEALTSHFQKFGKIIDIYIPANGENAFVQFSTREEAESALKAPDAVMGNRFIKLWWANRDSIPDHGTSSGNNSYMSLGSTRVSISNKGRSSQLLPPKGISTHAPTSISEVNDSSVSSTQITMPVQGKHATTPGLVALAPMKKLENLEVLKEELRKKQELLDQKRNEFKRQLDKLERQKQAAGVKSESCSEQPPKRQKVAMATDVKRLTQKSADISTSATLSEAEKGTSSNKHLVHDSNTVLTAPSEPTTNVNVLNLPLVESEDMLTNKSKLDNHPRVFKIVPPLPSNFADIITMREHFSLYGKVCDVELVNAEGDESHTSIIHYAAHHSAEKAFLSAKSWKGHDLQFTWVSEDIRESNKISPSAKEPMNADSASQNNVLQKKSIAQPIRESESAVKCIADNFTVSMVEVYPSKYNEETASDNQPAKDVVKHEKQLSEDRRYAENADSKMSYNDDSVIPLEDLLYQEDDEKAYDKHLFDDEIRRSNEEHPRNSHVDYMDEEHSIGAVDEKKIEVQPSEDAVM